MADHSPYQKKIIKRYYDNLSNISLSKLQELTSEIYLAEGKKADRLWKQVETTLAKLAIAPSRTAQLLAKRDPAMLAQLVKELS